MHAVIRNYSGNGAGALFDLLETRKGEVETMMRSIPGFTSYTLVRTDDGGISVTICNDKSGTDQSIGVARDWIGRNAADLHAGPPVVAEGTVILHSR